MKNLIPRAILVMALGASSMLMAARAMADEWPLVPGSYWEVTGVKIKDGGGTSGVVSGTTEAELNLAISLRVRALLERAGVRVVMTRNAANTRIAEKR